MTRRVVAIWAMSVATLPFIVQRSPLSVLRSFSGTLNDERRTMNVSAEKPSRIVSLIPAVTQILFAVGAGPQVVGVSNYDREPAEVTTRAKVGGLLDPDTERILALRPDLVIVYEGQQELASRLQRAGIAMYTYRHRDLADVIRTIRSVGARVGHEQEAETVASDIERTLDQVRRRVEGRPRPSTILVLGREPNTLRNIYASGGYGFLHDMLVVAGARDALDDIKRESVQLSAELILARAPDAIVELHYGGNPSAVDDVAPWRRLSSVPAVRDGRIYELVGDEFVEAGPRIGDATERLSRALHPDAWK